MFNTGDIIDGKYRVQSLCSDMGGMGTIVHIKHISGLLPDPIVLKYCKETDDESKKRFSREVKYLAEFKGNSMVMQVLDSNLTMDPPYFVMKCYTGGDLLQVINKIQSDIGFQENIFDNMLSCIAELHAQGLQHRDIKPQNFLVEGDSVVVSDLGLAKDVGAGTTFTGTLQSYGTEGYMPPEFYLSGGFKNATPQSDIFMLGKTIYVLLTNRNPRYLTDSGIHPALYHVIERCSDQKPTNRYPTIAHLRQGLKLAYDVILNRAKGIGTSRQILSQIVNRLNADNKYVVDEITELLDLLAMLPEDERYSMLRELPDAFYLIIGQAPFKSKIGKFLDQYEKYTETAVGTWSYAEIVARNMKSIFMENSAEIIYRARALEIAIEGAIWANRFVAMDTCAEMITSVADDALGIHVAAVIDKHRALFINNIETSRCKNDIVRNAIQAGHKTSH